MRKKNQWKITDIETGRVSYFSACPVGKRSLSFGVGSENNKRSKYSLGIFIKGGLTVLISVLVIFTVVKASTVKITPPSGAPVATFYSLSEIYEFIVNNSTSTVGSPALDFSAALEDTGHTLTEIYNKLALLISAGLVKKDTIYLGVTGTLVPTSDGGNAVVADLFSDKTAQLTADWTLDTGTLNLACNTTTFDGTGNLVADTYDGAGNGANRWCMATSTNSASASDIVQYKSAWVNGSEISGSFASTTEIATTTGVDITPSAGTWFSKITVAITNLIAGVIKSGETVGGVDGSLLPSSGTATPANVATGTTFFGASQSNWTLQTGTFDPWSPQRLQTVDDATTTNEYILEEATWSAVTGSPFSGYDAINYQGGTNLYSGAVKQDTRTGLWWSDIMAVGATASTTSNSFTLTADGSRPTGGYAIGFCNALNSYDSPNGFAGHNDWYLPTQKELQQAYIDGSANNLDRPAYTFWSSTEHTNDAPNAWSVYLNAGHTNNYTKTTLFNVRCVRR